MCGIAGILENKSSCARLNISLIEEMNRAQHHRGPDGSGIHIEPGLALGHSRLSIIDLESGTQPLFNEDGSIAIVFNGEIYNYRELRGLLRSRGHTFKTESDTEVLVHAYEEWGPGCVEKLRGMFAFALWDQQKEQLFLARDRIGIKPLHYAEPRSGGLIFASELKALLIHPDLSRQIDACAVEDYFAYGYIPDPRTIFKQVKKLPPGHWLLLRRGMPLRIERYWDLPVPDYRAPSKVADLEQELIHRLRESVACHLVSDVPLAAFLSGGVDSSAVVAMMAELHQDPISTCSISFKEKMYDEGTYAKMVAARYSTNHHEKKVLADDTSLLDRLAAIYDEPFADSSALPTYRLSELAASKVKVVLSGDGGDETFAGYRSYRLHLNKDRLRRLMPASCRVPFFHLLAGIYPKADWAPRIFRAKRSFEDLASSALESFGNGAMITTTSERQALYSAPFKNELSGYNALEVLRNHAASCPCDDPVAFAQYLDFKTYLPGDILTKVDRASMAQSLEVRVPILDHCFLEWAWNLPTRLKLHSGEGKYIFKKSLIPYLPREILYRKKKGFEIPLLKWSRGRLKDKIRSSLLHGGLISSGIFNRRSLLRIVEENEKGLRNHSSLLWALLQFEAFYTNLRGEREDSFRADAA